jgi:hypothetical protein
MDGREMKCLIEDVLNLGHLGVAVWSVRYTHTHRLKTQKRGLGQSCILQNLW